MEAIGVLFHFLLPSFVHADINFIYNGFLNANLTLEGASIVKSNGILALTNDSARVIGHAFYPSPLQFKKLNPNNNTASAMAFSTNFVFSITPKYPDLGGHGLAFVLISAKKPKTCLASQYLGFPNDTSNGRFLAVEFDVVQNLELQDINDNHVGIDISSMISIISKPAAYYSANGSDFNDNQNNSINLKGGEPIQAWIEYDSKEMMLNVSVSPRGLTRQFRPLISFPINLSSVLDEYMYVGFSSSTGLLTALHYVHGWSFNIGGQAQDLDPRKLPFYTMRSNEVVHKKGFAVGITLASVALVFLVIIGAILIIRRIRNGDEILEDWEIEYGARRFKYSELLSAANGFREKTLVGSGGFRRVYRGVIPSTRLEGAIKRMSNGSRQGMQEFIAEITSMARLRHRNLVQLHGWCRKQDELLLVYDYVPNGSLDKLLYEEGQMKGKKLTWEQRYKILTDVAQALLYLHEESEQRVIHRDVKPSNVLIDEDLNAKLGDFGLARTYNHDSNPQTTHIVGTLGYLAPELTSTGKATTCTDVYGYGVLVLEVASRRRPIDPQRAAAELLLVDCVGELHSQGEITRAIDLTLENYNSGEAELVLTLGLLCCHPHPDYRPTMRRVVQFLMGDATLPLLPRNIHREIAKETPEYSNSNSDVSDSSCYRTTSSQNNSFTS